MGGRRLGKGRRNRRRERGKRVLLAFNGALTEPEYFRMLVAELGIGGLAKIDLKSKGKDPTSLVKHAAKAKEDDFREAKREGFDPYAEVWAIADTDEFEVGEAQRTADEKRVLLALSNPCFEVWLIDHKAVCPSSCATSRRCSEKACELGVVKPADARRASAKKAKMPAFQRVSTMLPIALENAAAHNTEEKARARRNNVARVDGYAVWTDIPDVIRSLQKLE